MHYISNYNFRNLFYALVLLITVSSCATEFEKIRSSADPKIILSKANEYYKDKQYGNARSLYELAIQYYRGKTEAEDIFYNFAYTYYYLGDYITASSYFKNFGSTFYNSTKREDAEFMVAYSNYRMSPNFKLDQTFSVKAIEGFQDFITKFPTSSRVPECNRLIDEMRLKMAHKSFEQGRLYYDMKDYDSAIQSSQNSLKDYPGSKYQDESRFLIIKSSFEFAEKSIIQRQNERYELTIGYCNRYIKRIKDPSILREVKLILKKSTQKVKTIKV